MMPNQPGKISSVYFIGIGGIGMSALARYFNLQGASVSGYDKTPTALTARLIEEGIPVHFTEDLQLIPSHPDLVVYTPAVPSDHAEMKYYRETVVPMKKRAEVLGEITASGKTIAVAGTHGKTTVSTLIAHILQTANQPFMGFLGGISKNHGGNFLFFPPHLSLEESQSGQALNVVEADEYDRSFLRLTPSVAIITAADPDHLDIYGHPEDLIRSFEAFTSRIQKGGHLILKQGVAISGGDYRYNVLYQYTKLNDIKVGMIEEASANARASAEQFAADSKSKLGKIKEASQGQISITDRDPNTPHVKQIRVVTSVSYFLKD